MGARRRPGCTPNVEAKTTSGKQSLVEFEQRPESDLVKFVRESQNGSFNECPRFLLSWRTSPHLSGTDKSYSISLF